MKEDMELIGDHLKTLVSRHLGPIEWDPAGELLLPFGFPGFEGERRMVAVEIPTQRPLVFLQSAEKPEMCFVSLPVLAIKPDYELLLNEEDRSALRIEDESSAEIGVDLLCLALLFPAEGGLQANLGAPILINLHNLRCVQSEGNEQGPRYYRLGSVGGWEPVCW